MKLNIYKKKKRGGKEKKEMKKPVLKDVRIYASWVVTVGILWK